MHPSILQPRPCRVYFLLQGSVEIINEFGMVIDQMAGGVAGETQFFGEVGLLEDVPRTATVKAKQDCTTLSLGKGELARLLSQAPAVRAQMLVIAKERMQNFLMRTVLA